MAMPEHFSEWIGTFYLSIIVLCKIDLYIWTVLSEDITNFVLYDFQTSWHTGHVPKIMLGELYLEPPFPLYFTFSFVCLHLQTE